MAEPGREAGGRSMRKGGHGVDKTVARVASVRPKGERRGKGPRAGLRKNVKCTLVYKTVGRTPANSEKRKVGIQRGREKYPEIGKAGKC